MAEGSSNCNKNEDAPIDASWLLSGVYCMLLVILSIVVCSSHYSTTDVSDVTVDVYYIFLTVLGSVWLITYRCISFGCCLDEASCNEVKANHTTNRWLKGILLVFGLAIVIKDILDLLKTTQYSDQSCYKAVYYLAPISEMIFIIAEVNFLFRNSKIHLQTKQSLNRFGAMHVMATNLSIWILIIIDESKTEEEELSSTTSHDTSSETSTLLGTYSASALYQMAIQAGCNSTMVLDFFNQSGISLNQDTSSGDAGVSRPGDLLHNEECPCDTDYCEVLDNAHTYLYPFLVEFSLVASCMMYIVWKNVGMIPRDAELSPKPSYKFYRSYKGLILGCIVLIVTIVILIFSNYGVDTSHGSYDSAKTVVLICNSYMDFVEFFMLIACAVGIVLFRIEKRALRLSPNLDVILLMVTFAGAATVDMYYLFAVYASLISTSYDYSWISGAVYPVVDLIQCVIQVAFLLGGLAREPVICEIRDTTFSVIEGSVSDIQLDEGESDSSETIKSFEGNSVSDIHVESEIGSPETTKENDESDIQVDESEIGTSEIDKSISGSSDSGILMIELDNDAFELQEDKEIAESPPVTEVSIESNEVTTESKKSCDEKVSSQRNDKPKHLPSVTFRKKARHAIAHSHVIHKEALEQRIRIHEGRPRIKPPNLNRLHIRELMIFLLISNASLWLFWSLQGPSLKSISYPHTYYDSKLESRNLWLSATMLCLPLAIFFRMHSCACIFEAWSFA